MNNFYPRKLETSTNFIGGPESINKKTICDFWQWSFSDLMQNTTRGILAEYIVAALLEIDDAVRNPWFAFDLQLQDGRTIEIKTISLLQAWKQKSLSVPRVVLAPTRKWDPISGEMEKEPTFNADIYIICFFNSKDHAVANPLDLKQWEFFVFTKRQLIKLLDGRKSISLAGLEKQNIESVEAFELKQKINSI
jgi:hypothetical protein